MRITSSAFLMNGASKYDEVNTNTITTTMIERRAYVKKPKLEEADAAKLDTNDTTQKNRQ